MKIDIPILKVIEKKINLLVLIIISIGLTSGLLLAHIKYFSPFTPLDLSPINYSNLDYPLSSNKFIYVKLDLVIGYVLTFMIFSKITDLTVEEIMFLPLGNIVLPLGYFVLAKHLLKSYYNSYTTYFIAIILTIYIIFDTYIGTYFYSVFKYALNYFLLSLFLSLYITITRNKNATRNYNEKIIAIILIFISMSMIHYTVPFLAVCIIIIDYIIGSIRKNDTHRSILLVFIVLTIFIISNLEVVKSYFTDWAVGGEDKIINALNAIQAYIYGGLEKEYITYTDISYITTMLKSVRGLLIALPIAIYFIIYFIKHNIKLINGLLLAILITSIIHSLIYINIGSPSIISPTHILMLPLISVILFNHIRVKEKLVIVYILSLLLVVIVSYITQFYDIDYRDLYYSIIIDRSYIIDKMNLDDKTLVDLRVGSLYFLQAVKHDKTIIPLYITNHTYESLVNNNYSYQNNYRYVILPFNNKPMPSGWDLYKPPNVYADKINSNPRLNKIDQVGTITIYYKTAL